MSVVYWIAACTNQSCAVLTYRWENPGDECPKCRWIGAPCGGAVTA